MLTVCVCTEKITLIAEPIWFSFTVKFLKVPGSLITILAPLPSQDKSSQKKKHRLKFNQTQKRM